MVDLKLIWSLQKPSEDHLIIKTKIEEIELFNCYAATNHISGNHLYIMELDQNLIIPSFKNLTFKGVRIEVFDLENRKELNIFLLDIELKEIFSLFIENILDEILLATTQADAIKITEVVTSKWKRLFDKISRQGLSLEQQKGLLGELIFFLRLLDSRFKSNKILNSWTGPDADDKDFTFGSRCVEIKITTSKLPTIKISNERQLDSTNLTQLFLIQFSCEILGDSGFTLNNLVDQIRDKLKFSESDLIYFNEKLGLVQYFDYDREYYNTAYGILEEHFYEVNNFFPRLTNDSLPDGIYNSSYNIERAAIENFRINFEDIITNI